MCGIFGLLHNNLTTEEWETTLRVASDHLIHRGPDDLGIWYDSASGIGFGHRRLSIVDLSYLGHQPMESASGRYVITYNGEVYNFKDMGEKLKSLGHAFKGHSDTEVLLAGFEQWGVEETIQRCIGMFAFALWDRQTHTLHLVRDRLGIKPLYYGWVGDAFVFSSELKPLSGLPENQNAINRDALALFMRHNYIPAPFSIYQKIHKLPPGTKLSVKTESSQQIGHPEPYWSAREIVLRGQNTLLSSPMIEIIDQLDALLRDAVNLRMIADVPLGAFLSGGIDSSTIVALMQAQSNRPIRTFSIGFTEKGYDEAEYAKTVAQYLGTSHTELYITPEEAMAIIPRLPTIYDEPFADVSQIPTFLVSELARKQVTVSLSGDGGDELFAGYSRYAFARDVWRGIAWLPLWGRKILSKALVSIPRDLLDRCSDVLMPSFHRYGRKGFASDKLQKFAELMGFNSHEALYYLIISHFKNPTSVVLNATEPPTIFTEPWDCIDLQDYTHRMMYLDLITYLPDDILVKLDRASMGVSLEARVPFLDHRVVEFVWRLPINMKVHDGQSKWLLKQLLHRYVPQQLIERPKMGFGVPIGDWLRGKLRDWAESLIDERRLRAEGYLAPSLVRKLWGEHLSGRCNWSYKIWDILMFQAWLEQNSS